MRLWHIELIQVLPKLQLLGQWRELCAIAKKINQDGTPGHMLVDWITEYPPEHLDVYACVVAGEMRARGYNCDTERYWKWRTSNGILQFGMRVFEGKMGNRYLMQCFCNLQEKFDCGGVAFDEFENIAERVQAVMEGRLLRMEDET